MFNKAVKTESKLRMAIAGPSGSGKTYTALSVAEALVPGGKVAVIDTEHGSAAKYADLFSFDVAQAAPPYHPDGLNKLVTFAANNGYDVVIVDSVSHYWNGAGGILDIKEDIERKMRNPNSYTSWKDVTPIHQRMVDTLVAIPAHIIVTMRSKQDYVLVERNGKQVPQKIGMAPVQRDGFEYEFDVMLDMDIENVGRVQKTRCPALTGAAIVKPGADLAGILREWLTGAAPTEAPKPVVFTPPANGNATNGKKRSIQSEPEPVYDTVEDIILSTHAGDFVTEAAKLLQIADDTLRERMKRLGYTSIPGKPEERVKMFHALKVDVGPAGQEALFTDDPDAVKAAVDTAAGKIG